MPTAAAAAANDTMTVTIVCAFDPRANRYVNGMSRNRTICLHAIRLVRGSGENAVETSVITAYATSGHANDGISNFSCSRTMSANQQTTETVSSACAMAMENCSAP